MAANSNSWKKFLSSLPGDDGGDRNANAFTAAVHAETEIQKRIQAMVEDPNSVVLVADNEKRFNIIHSPKNLGGRMTRPTNKLVGLMGLGTSGIGIEINETSVSAVQKIATPVLESIWECTTEEQVKGLEPNGQIIGYKGSMFFLPAPYLRKAILNSGLSAPFELIPVAVAAAKEFAQNHEGEQNIKDAAIEHAQAFVSYCWSVGAGKIPETRIFPRPDDEEINAYCAKRHRICIFPSRIDMTREPPSQMDNNSVITQCSVNMLKQNEVLGESDKLRREELSSPSQRNLFASSKAPSRQRSFHEQMDEDAQRGRRPLLLKENAKSQLQLEIGDITNDITAPFLSKFVPSDMRQLALVAHNHMKPAMKKFIETYSEVLKKFRITGTQTTMRMCKSCWGEDNPNIQFGLACTSGPLGGDAQIAALMCMQDLGALIFFVDPLSAHPHQADIDSLLRLSNCGNVIVCPNPTSAMGMMHTLKGALEKGSRGMIPSFFQTLESPAVAEYKHQQELALTALVKAGRPERPTLMPGISMHLGEVLEPMIMQPEIPLDPDDLGGLGSLHPDLDDLYEEEENEVDCNKDEGEEEEEKKGQEGGVVDNVEEKLSVRSNLKLQKEKSTKRMDCVASLYGIMA